MQTINKKNIPETITLKIEKLSKSFEIEESLTDVISSYSHGMKQKLVIIWQRNIMWKCQLLKLFIIFYMKIMIYMRLTEI